MKLVVSADLQQLIGTELLRGLSPEQRVVALAEARQVFAQTGSPRGAADAVRTLVERMRPKHARTPRADLSNEPSDSAAPQS